MCMLCELWLFVVFRCSMPHVTISSRFSDEMTSKSREIEAYENSQENSVYIPNDASRDDWESVFKNNLKISAKGGYMLQLVRGGLSDTQVCCPLSVLCCPTPLCY